MATKKTVFVEAELEWAEEQLSQWKEYVDANPLIELKDRLDFKETKNGGMVKTVIASIESQGKFIQDTMKNYLSLLKEVGNMREQEEQKKQVRGNQTLSPMEEGDF